MPISFLEPIVEKLTEIVWNRPELASLREPIETALKGNEFKKLTQQAFEQFAQANALSSFFNAEFITQSPVQDALAAYIVEGRLADVDELVRRYRAYIGKDEAGFHDLLAKYLQQVRHTFVNHPAYGGLILARGQDAMLDAISVFRREVQDRLDKLGTDQKTAAELILNRLDLLFKEPEIKALVERKQGTHIFLSYSRHDAETARHIREVLENAGHTVWQDTTAIKGGDEWIKSISDGVRRAYAVVTVVSHEANQSKWVTREYLAAEEWGKSVVPIRIDTCEVPLHMIDRQVIKGFPNLTAGIQKLLERLPSPEAGGELQQTLERPNRRQLELNYLNDLLLKYGVWQEVYTPMAGVGEIAAKETESTLMASNAEIDNLFEAIFMSKSQQEIKIERKEYIDILAAIREMRQLVILGDPGAGKTTTLWKIAADAAITAKDDPARPLPVMLRLGDISAEVSVRDYLQQQLGQLRLDELFAEKRITILLDGLNELRKERRNEKVAELRTMIQKAKEYDLIIAVTCRELDYTDSVDLYISQRITIKPLDALRIRNFLNSYFMKEPKRGEELFWALTYEPEKDIAKTHWQWFQAEFGDDEQTFWLKKTLPKSFKWESESQHWKDWLKLRDHIRSLMRLASNPYMLYMIVKVFQHFKAIPQNRGELFAKFVTLLVRREQGAGLTPAMAERMKICLGELAFAMQQQGEGTGFDQAIVMRYLDENSFYFALSTNMLIDSDEIRFTHQLLQEYFAACKLKREILDGKSMQSIWQQDREWDLAGWEETVIVLAGLYNDDTTPIIDWVKDVNPELTIRCILESGAYTPHETRNLLQSRWLPRLTELEAYPNPKTRAAIGRALGSIALDSRPGIGLCVDGLPDIDWIEIPLGVFQFGGDPYAYECAEMQEIYLPTFYIARFPVTYTQFRTFLDSADGLQNSEWFEGLAASDNDKMFRGRHSKHGNHPCENVNWYQSVAFCRWLSKRLGYDVTLPTEQQWEKAARGIDGRFYSYGNEFAAEKGNTYESSIRQTTAAGIFPNGVSPYGVLDMSGNVWEWCLNRFNDPDDITLSGTEARVLRGGSWDDNRNFARVTYRSRYSPKFNSGFVGFRLVRIGG